VAYGIDLMEFNADIDVRSQSADARALAWDPATQAVLDDTQTPQDLGLQGNLAAATLAGVLPSAKVVLRTAAAAPKAALTGWAKAQMLKSGLARVRGRVRFQGSALALPGTLLELAGVGERFNGKAFVGAVQHEVDTGNWTTEAELGLDPAWLVTRPDVTTPPAAALLPGVRGLQVGVVTKLDADPDGAHRVQVRTPAHEGGDLLPIWARLLQPYASNGFGFFFLPEIGDEVLVGHLADDPGHPVVLGSLYSAKHAPPYTADAKNTVKSVVTRSKVKIEVNDEDKILTLLTPAKNTLVFSDKDKRITLQDENGNKVVLDNAGVAISSPKDVTVDAKGKVAIKAVQGVTVEATAGDVTVKGMNVTCQGQVGFTGKGAATAELSASGQTTVKGAMVMIN
jgi:Rhs element Vgr protein